MKIAMDCRQDDEYLNKCNEINIDYRDRDYIYDLINKYPDKKYVLNLCEELNIDWDFIDQLNRATDSLILRVGLRTEDIIMCSELGYSFFAGYPINDWAALKAYVELSPVYIVPAGELFFNLPEVKKYNIPIRVAVNQPYLSSLITSVNTEMDLTIPSEWIRPDDIDIYADYIDIIEFANVEKSKQQALYRIYMNEKHWPGSLQMIINGLKTDATCRLIEPELFTRRIDCKRKCLSGGACRLCYRLFALANYDRLKEYKETVIDN